MTVDCSNALLAILQHVLATSRWFEPGGRECSLPAHVPLIHECEEVHWGLLRLGLGNAPENIVGNLCWCDITCAGRARSRF